MITPPPIRDEEPPDDAVIVVRGGLHSLDHDRVREACEDSMADSGFYGLSVFAAVDGDVVALCQRIERLRSPGILWTAGCGDLRSEGFSLLATDAEPHFDVVLADMEPGTIEKLIRCFRSMPNPAKRR